MCSYNRHHVFFVWMIIGIVCQSCVVCNVYWLVFLDGHTGLDVWRCTVVVIVSWSTHIYSHIILFLIRIWTWSINSEGFYTLNSWKNPSFVWTDKSYTESRKLPDQRNSQKIAFSRDIYITVVRLTYHSLSLGLHNYQWRQESLRVHQDDLLKITMQSKYLLHYRFAGSDY